MKRSRVLAWGAAAVLVVAFVFLFLLGRGGPQARFEVELEPETGASGVADPAPRLETTRARLRVGGVEALDEESIEPLEPAGPRPERARVVRGRVVADDGLAVAGADVVLSSKDGKANSVVTRTRADGRFALYAVNRRQLVGARAMGFGPSFAYPLREWFGIDEKKGSFEIVIPLRGAGGGVRGRVLDASGKPLAGAEVRVEDESPVQKFVKRGDRSLRSPFLFEQVTAADGRFEFRGVPAQAMVLKVEAEGHALWASWVDVPARAMAEVALQLQAPAKLVGQVRDESGKIRPGALILFLPRQFPDPLREFSSATSSAVGKFEIEGLQPGEARVRAHDRERGGLIETNLELRAGETTEWNPVVPLGSRIKVRFLDSEDEPLVGWKVKARDPKNRSNQPEEITDAEGRVVLKVMRPWGYTLRFTPPNDESGIAPLAVQDLRPVEEEHTVHLPAGLEPSARIVGGLRNEAGETPKKASITVLAGDRGSTAKATWSQETGRFESPLIPPGRYSLSLSSKGHPVRRTGPYELGVGQVLDLGAVELAEAGTLRVLVEEKDGVRSDHAWFRVNDAEGRSLHLGTDHEGEIRFPALAPGSYEFHVTPRPTTLDGGVEWLRVRQAWIPFTIAAGKETLLECTLERGLFRTIVFTDPADVSRRPASLDIEVRDAQGELVRRESVDRYGSMPIDFEISLAKGRYLVVATGADAVRGEGWIEVTALDRLNPRVEIPLN